MNGATAPPDDPIADISDSEVTSKWLSISRVTIVMVHGYIGPKRIPTMVTNTALDMMLGTVQTRTWKSVEPRIRQ